jgi:transcription factor STE12
MYCARSISESRASTQVTTHQPQHPDILKRSNLSNTRKLTSDLSRHKRTHDRGDGAEGGFPLSGEDEEEYSGEDQLGSLEEASPNSEGGYISNSLNSLAHGHGTPTSNGMSHANHMSHAPSYNSLQTLSMPMTMSTPAGVMM